MNRLISLGYNNFFNDSFNKLNRSDLIPGRVAAENKSNYLVFTETGEVVAEPSGSLMYSTDSKSDLPKVGDWVALAVFDDLGIIHHVLKRQNKLSRRSADKKIEEQVIAVNIDTVFIMQSADENFNLNRMERQLTAIYSSKAEPAIILSKTDLAEDPELLLKSITERIENVSVFPISSFAPEGIREFENNLVPNRTYTILGSSGVGKSTLINKLLGEEILKVNEVKKSDSKGKHTTTRREMILLPIGGIIIDMPGMREFGLWEDKNGIASAFNEFEDFSGLCKYDDCTHIVEKGCAVIEAVEHGKIPQARYENYLKLRKELNYLETKIDERKALEVKKKWKSIMVEYRNFTRRNKNNI